MTGTYHAAWPIRGLLSLREAENMATPVMRLMLHRDGYRQAGPATWEIWDANDRDATRWPEEPDLAQILVAHIPVEPIQHNHMEQAA